ncbi:MAG: hypothetical protein ACTSQY_04030 [Candidatus Odinarchaeia archaeon]
MNENLVRISITIPKNIVEKLDQQTPNRSFFITKLLSEKLFGKIKQFINLEINSRKNLKAILDPERKFFINIAKFHPILAASLEESSSSGPKIKLVSLKQGVLLIITIDLNKLKEDEELITDSSDWLRIMQIYEPTGEFAKYLIENEVLIVDKIKSD